MEEDDELEAAMLSISPSKLLSQSRDYFAVTLDQVLKFILLPIVTLLYFVFVYAGSAEKEGTPVPKPCSRAKTGFFLNKGFQGWGVILSYDE